MRHHPLPVVVVSSMTPAHSDAALRALALGAVEVIAKPTQAQSASELRGVLLPALRTAARARVSALREPEAPSATAREPGNGVVRTAKHGPDLIAIGASTGGPAAIERVLSVLPANAPAIVIVQHMPAGFTAAFARRLNERCALQVSEARAGEPLEAGHALIAPSGCHMLVVRRDRTLRIALREGPPIQHHRPAIDVLFHSVAEAAGANTVGVLLTGMGADGASGMCALRAAGARTIAQDEATSVVFSMPGEAIRSGGACEVLPLHRIAEATLSAPARRRAPTLTGND